MIKYVRILIEISKSCWEEISLNQIRNVIDGLSKVITWVIQNNGEYYVGH